MKLHPILQENAVLGKLFSKVGYELNERAAKSDRSTNAEGSQNRSPVLPQDSSVPQNFSPVYRDFLRPTDFSSTIPLVKRIIIWLPDSVLIILCLFMILLLYDLLYRVFKLQCPNRSTVIVTRMWGLKLSPLESVILTLMGRGASDV